MLYLGESKLEWIYEAIVMHIVARVLMFKNSNITSVMWLLQMMYKLQVVPIGMCTAERRVGI